MSDLTERAQYITERMGLRDPIVAVVMLCLWREARGECHEGRAAIAHVIRNRATDAKGRWPADPTRVVLQPRQFSSFNPGDPNNEKYPETTDPLWADCFGIACDVFGKPQPPPDPTGGANHYHAVSVAPKWADPSGFTVQIGRHRFYRL